MTVKNVLTLFAAFASAIFVAVAPTGAAAQDAIAQEASERQILVMLRMPLPHYRPGNSYGGSYGDVASEAARKRIARSIERQFMLQLVDSWPMPLLGVDCFIMRVPDDRDTDMLIAAVSKNPNVAWSQPLNTYYTKAAPDPFFPVQPTAREWQLDSLHRLATGKGVKVAVIDSQVDVKHPDLAGQIGVQRDFVSNRPVLAEEHGTGVAGVIAALAGNGLGIVGVAPRAQLMALRACSQTAQSGSAACNSLALARAIEFAIENGADIVNLSLAGPSDRLLTMLIEQGLEKKITFVSAYDPQLPKGGFPASLAGVLPIADETMASAPAGIYLAPGRDIPVTKPGGKWGLASGNSFATAQVSGLLALAREKRRKGAGRLVPARQQDGVIDACSTLLPTSQSCVTAHVRWSDPSRNHDRMTLWLAAATSLAISSPATAQVAGEVALQSDYRDRGFSLSGEEPALSISLAYDDPTGLYMGTYATGSWLKGSPRLVGAKAFVGHTLLIGTGVTADAGVVQTHYSAASVLHRTVDFTEVYVGLATRHVSTRVFYAPDYWNFGIPSIYAQLDGGFNVTDNLTISGHAGYLAYPKQPALRYIPDRQDWRLGVARRLGTVTLQSNVSGRFVRGHHQDTAVTVGISRPF